MIGSTRRLRVWAWGGPVDLRNGFDGLAALVANGLKQNPLSGDVFLFVARDRMRAKALVWDGTGLCIYAKRLERGRFAAPWLRAREGGSVEMTMSELALFFEGSKLVERTTLSPAPLEMPASVI